MVKTIIISNVFREGDFVKLGGIIYRIILNKGMFNNEFNEVVIKKVA
jgi:hypothetical protein